MTILFLLRHGFFRATKNGPNILRESKKNMAGVINVSLLLQLTKGKKIVCFFIIFIILISMMMNVILFMKILFLFVISIRN